MKQDISPESAKKANERAHKHFRRTVSIIGSIDILAMAVAVTSLFNWFSKEAFAFAFSTVFISSFLLLIINIIWRIEKEGFFWKEVAEENGYKYVDHPHFQNTTLMFREGSGKYAVHGLVGTIDNQAFRFFQYMYFLGHGKGKRLVSYSVFEISFSGKFPHIYLNNTKNRDLSNFKEAFLNRIGLPGEFDSRFRLYGPKGYEIEVLEVFTPDILALLLDQKWNHDLEMVDSKLFVFCENMINTKSELKEELDHLQVLIRSLAPKLNHFTFTPVDNLKHVL